MFDFRSVMDNKTLCLFSDGVLATVLGRYIFVYYVLMPRVMNTVKHACDQDCKLFFLYIRHELN